MATVDTLRSILDLLLEVDRQIHHLPEGEPLRFRKLTPYSNGFIQEVVRALEAQEGVDAGIFNFVMESIAENPPVTKGKWGDDDGEYIWVNSAQRLSPTYAQFHWFASLVFDPQVRCSVITTSGNQCRNWARQSRGGRCGSHQHPRFATKMESANASEG